MPYFLYVLQSETSGRLYIGQTNDVERRLNEHQRGKYVSTRNRGPWQLLFQIKFDTRKEAVALERKLKRMKRPDRVLNYLKKLA